MQTEEQTKSPLRMMVYASLLAALTAASALFSIQIGDVPVILYNFFILLMGLLLYYAREGQVGIVALNCLVILGTVQIPYARARAECFLPECSVGWMERPERILLLAVGAITHLLPLVLGLMALLTHVTVIQRIYYCWKHLSRASEGVPGGGGQP